MEISYWEFHTYIHCVLMKWTLLSSPTFPYSPLPTNFTCSSLKTKQNQKKELSACMYMSVGLPTGAWVAIKELHPWRKHMPPAQQLSVVNIFLLEWTLWVPPLYMRFVLLTSSCACGPKQCQFICANGALCPGNVLLKSSSQSPCL